jgi:hypothetical protein
MEHVAPNINQLSATATHAPILSAVASKAGGPIIEIGVGHHSTPMLHFIARAIGRHITSIDTNADWISFFSCIPGLGSDHRYLCTGNRLISAELPRYLEGTGTWGVAFVDCSPEIDRKKCVELMRNRAKYIVVHDAEPLAKVYDWGNLFDTFKSKFYWDFYGNGTIVVSMTEDCSWLS